MSHRAVAIVIAGFFTAFIAFAIRYSYGLLLPEMLPALAISKTEAGIIFSSYFITATLLSPVLGLLVDRSDARILISTFVAMLGIGTYLMSFSSSVIQASIFFCLAGIGHSACWAPVVTVVMRWVSEKRRGIVLAFVDLGSTAGIAVCSITIPLMTGAYSWRTVWVSLGIFAFIVAAMNFFMIKSHPPFEPGPGGSGTAPRAPIPIRVAYMAIIRDKKFYLIGLSYLLLSFSILVPLTFLTTFATQELKIPYQSAAGLLAVFAVVGAAAKLFLSHLSDVVGRVRVMMFCGVLTAIGGLGLAYVHAFLLLVLFTAVFGAGYGTIWPVFAAAARDFFPKEYAGSVVGLWTVFHGLGSIMSPVIAGWTIDGTGAYVWAFILAMISSIISILLLFPMAKTK
ncbi:MAG: MFS transporter [Deltaproteobacteria bacterium]|nr:MFS transporter [Deltaproteobacteria bacterium]